MFRKVDFSKYSSIKIGPLVDVALIDEENFQEFSNHTILGGANNLLLCPTPPPLAMLSKKYDFIKLEGDTLHIGAATPTGKVVSFCKKHNIANFEFLAHLPGKMGGIIKMNAGLKESEIFNTIQSVTINEKKVLKEQINYGYRFTDIEGIIFSATFKIAYGFEPKKIENFKKMRTNQPKEASAGSLFKNPEGDYAGRLIEAVGYKGKRIGNMEFSKVHANFLVNHREDTKRDDFSDAMALIEGVKKAVYEQFGILLTEEVVIL